MKEEVKETTTSTAFTKKLDTPLPYTFKYTVYENTDELVAAKDELTLEEQVKVRNAERAANARNKAMNAAILLAGHVKPTIDNDQYTRLMTVYKGIASAKVHTKEKAMELAAMSIGLAAWPEEYGEPE